MAEQAWPRLALCVRSVRELEEQRKQCKVISCKPDATRKQPAPSPSEAAQGSRAGAGHTHAEHSFAEHAWLRPTPRVQSIRELEEQRKQITAAGKHAADLAARQQQASQGELKAERELAADLQVGALSAPQPSPLRRPAPCTRKMRQVLLGAQGTAEQARTQARGVRCLHVCRWHGLAAGLRDGVHASGMLAKHPATQPQTFV